MPINKINRFMLADEINQELDGITTQLAQIATQAKSYGAVGDGVTNDLTFIQNAINDVSTKGGGIVYLMPKHLINGTITLASNVTLKALSRTVIKSTNTVNIFNIPVGSTNVTIEGIIFDYESANSNIAILVNENVTNLRLNKLEFKNFYQSDITAQQNVIRLKTGITGNISDVSFKNIKAVGNGTIGDNGGAGRCIRTDSSGVTDLKNYYLNIDKINIEDCFSVNGSGALIVEDFDPITFQHYSDVSGIINLSNVTAKNFSKRLIKIQGDGVNITNVVAETTNHVPWLISVFAKNINISNVVAKGNITTIVEFSSANNVNVSNVQINSNYVGSSIYDVLFAFYNSSNINISQVSGNGYGGFLFYGEVTENITIDKVNLALSAYILFLQDRNQANGAYSNGKIQNINFTRASFKVLSTSVNAHLFDINGLGSVNPISQLSFRDLKLTTNQFYQWGLVRIKNATDVYFDNPNVENISTLTNPALITLYGNNTVQMRRLLINGTTTTNESQLNDTSNLLLTRSSVKNVALAGTGTKLELEKTPSVTLSYSGGATSGQVTIT